MKTVATTATAQTMTFWSGLVVNVAIAMADTTAATTTADDENEMLTRLPQERHDETIAGPRSDFFQAGIADGEPQCGQ